MAEEHMQSQAGVPRRSAQAVRAYCEEFCADDQVEQAADQIRAASTGTTSSEALLRTTRLIAAQHAPGAPAQRRWRGRRGAEGDDGCADVPGRLAARANGVLSAGEAHELDTHLESCPHCREIEQRANRAGEAFAAAMVTSPTDSLVRQQPGLEREGD